MAYSRRACDVNMAAALARSGDVRGMAAVEPSLEHWNAVAPRRKRAPGRRPRRYEGQARGPQAEPEADGEAVLRRLREAEEDLRISDFCSSALETVAECLRKQLEQLQVLTEAFGRLCLDLSPYGSEEPLATSTFPVKCVCYGLGNFASCVTARTQLAFMLLFLEKCQIPRSHCWAYDPLFSQTEVSVLSSLGVTVLSENEEGKCSVQGQPTVFYMPHCGTALYNNLLWSNWSADALSRVLIIGNSFQGLQERLLTRILQENYPYIAKVSDKIARWGCKAIVPAHVNEHTYWEGAPLEPAGASPSLYPNPFILKVSPAFPLPSGLKSLKYKPPFLIFQKENGVPR
ncbi:SRR1-like protein isoform X1 [Psammomys obesus]|uniref:SRR1-like protein isoform X1 n=1 Tax=Psammomys obesus TaxID=48139 RepID=UPI002452F8DF|nr:SRR1-like protein isoform X1 [Psammomys obesus]